MKMRHGPMTIDDYIAALKECCSQREKDELLRQFLQSRAVEHDRRSRLLAEMNTVPGRMTMFRPEMQAEGLGSDGSRPDGLRPDGSRPVGLASAVVGWFGVLLVLLTTSSAWAQAPAATVAAPALVASAAPVASVAPIAFAATKKKSGTKPLSAGSDPAAASLEAYLTRVRLDNKAVQSSMGAIWSDSGRLTRMSTDVRAMRPHDLISVVIDESLAASTDGTVKNSRATNASSGVSG